jgi:hypothetical protein
LAKLQSCSQILDLAGTNALAYLSGKARKKIFFLKIETRLTKVTFDRKKQNKNKNKNKSFQNGRPPFRGQCYKTFYRGNLPPFHGHTVILCYKATLPW